MSNVKFESYDGFVHGSFNFGKGEIAAVPEHFAQSWEVAGLGRVIKEARTTKMLPDPNVGGPDAPSSASQAAQVSQDQTAKESENGARKYTRRTGA